MQLQLPLYRQRPTRPTFPSAGMTLLRGLPDWLENEIRRELTWENPGYKPARYKLVDNGDGTRERVEVRKAAGEPLFCVYREHPNGILVPRYYWRADLATFGVVEPMPLQAGDFVHQIQYEPRAEQLPITAQLDAWDGDVNLQSPPASGKTFMFFYNLARYRGRGLMMVPNSNKFEEWHEAAKKYLGLRGDQIGTVRAAKRKWRGFPFTVAMVDTLACQDFDLEFQTGFALVGADEAHLTPCPHLGRALGQVSGTRMALTATPGSGKRRDLLDMHFGRKWLKLEVERPRCRFEFLPITMPDRYRAENWEFIMRSMSWDHWWSGIAAHAARQLMSQGRRVLVVAHIVDPLIRVHMNLGETGGFVIGHDSLDKVFAASATSRLQYEAIQGSSQPKRKSAFIEMSKSMPTMNPLFGTGIGKRQPANTGMDVDDLDGMVAMLPVPDPDTAYQLKGRLDRPHPTKQAPLGVVLVPDTPDGRQRAKAMMGHLRRLNCDVVEHSAVTR